MTTTNNESANLLGVFDNIQVRNEEKIAHADLEFCKAQQKEVEEVLSGLDKWYGIFHEAALELAESHQVKFCTNGSVEYCEPYRQHSSSNTDYQKYAFLPFENINRIVERRQRMIQVFTGNILKYFNQAYSLSVPFPEMDDDELPIDFVPQYMPYVDRVIAHLGGRGFRSTAEDELIQRVQTSVHRYGSHALPELKGKSIIFPSLIRFDSFYLQYDIYKIDWSESHHLEALCAGLAFYGHARLNGDTGIISGFDREKVDITEWYPLSTSPAEYIKFYKNGRVDVKFSDTASAEDCFQKLKLDEL